MKTDANFTVTAKNITTEADSIRAAKAAKVAANVRASKQRYASRVVRLKVTLSAEEAALLTRLGKKVGRKPTALLKELSMSSLHQQDKYIVPADLEERLSQLILEIRRLGTNTNQIAKVHNKFPSLKVKKLVNDLKETRQIISHLEAAVKNFVRNPRVEK